MKGRELFVITNSKTASLWHKFKNKKFRDAFVASQFKRSIPFQIAAVRKKLGWSQEDLADAAKLTQGVVSRAENPDYGNLTFNTVLRIASGLDVAVIIEFVPFSRLLHVFENRSEDSAPVVFEKEDKALAVQAAQWLRGEQIKNTMQERVSSEIGKLTTAQRDSTLRDKLGAPKELPGIQGAIKAPPRSILSYANT